GWLEPSSTVLPMYIPESTAAAATPRPLAMPALPAAQPRRSSTEAARRRLHRPPVHQVVAISPPTDHVLPPALLSAQLLASGRPPLPRRCASRPDRGLLSASGAQASCGPLLDIISRTASGTIASASPIFEASLPPPCAISGCPPPPPPVTAATRFSISPALGPFGITSGLTIATNCGRPSMTLASTATPDGIVLRTASAE